MLATQELGEADVIVTLLGESAGLVRGVAPSARKSRKRFGGTLEPLTRVRATWNEKQGRDLHRIETLELVRSYATMQAEPARQAACAVLAEIFRAVAREDQPEPQGFRLLGAVLDALEGGLDPFAAVRYAEYWTLRLHGVLADPSACADCGAPSRRHGVGEPGLGRPLSRLPAQPQRGGEAPAARRPGVPRAAVVVAAGGHAGACGRGAARGSAGDAAPWRSRGLRGAHAPGLPAPAGAQRPASG